MKKSILLLLSLMLCLILSPRVYAETVEKDKVFYEVNSDGQTVSLESITDNEQKETYRIPEKVEVNGKTYTVTAVKGGIFYAKKIVIPATVKQIDFGGVNWGDKELEVAPGNYFILHMDEKYQMVIKAGAGMCLQHTSAIKKFSIVNLFAF